ncbi:MAG: hypothetical protein WA364_24035 [Candidatus Nitrosopolaris sp.]
MNEYVTSEFIKDQMRKQYDFKIKGAKVFAACNEIKLSRPSQSRFRRLHLPPYTEEQFLEVSIKVLPKMNEDCSCNWKSSMGPERGYS